LLKLSLKGEKGGREGGKGPPGNSLGEGNCKSIVRDGYVCFPGLLHSAEHFSSGQHATAAVDDKFVIPEISRIIPSRGHIGADIASDILFEPTGDFHPTDIVL
jgi:hypothetical protein